MDFENTERLLELHARYGVPACFAVVGSAALSGARPYHDPQQIRRIHAAGHEIASHALVHEWLPALGPEELRQSLERSRQILEDCIGAGVVSFVPPFNQPFDYPARLSISLAERREAGRIRTGLGDLCAGLRSTGYRFCRVVYRSLIHRAAEKFLHRRVDAPVEAEAINGITCLRLNTPVGFTPQTLAVVERSTETGGYAVVYAHPHSISMEGPQNAGWLEPFLKRVAALRDAHRLSILLPREVAEVRSGVKSCQPLHSR
jgi:peptidoglycan/xylan/chitin deacetylase (PgdA/CDA1 family)